MSARLLLALAAVLALGSAACGANDEETTAPDDGARTTDDNGPVVEVTDETTHGSFSGVAMVHQTTYEGAEVEEETNAWDGTPQAGGPYSYASIPCNEDAPINNVSTDLPTFNTQIEGSRVPASTRHQPLEFEVVEDDEGDEGDLRLEGTITLTVCQLRPGLTPDPDPVPDSDKHKIDFEWWADFHDTTDEEVAWRGEFEIVGGTGIYEELTGQGTIAGYFLCFAPEGCEGLGEFVDGQYSLIGTYEIPTAVVEEARAPLYESDDDAGDDGMDDMDDDNGMDGMGDENGQDGQDGMDHDNGMEVEE